MYDDPAPLDISSPSNSRVKWLVGLRKRRTRDTEGVTLLEGHDELLMALEAGVEPIHLFYAPELVDPGAADALLDRVRSLGAEVVAMAKIPFAKASYRESPDGWLAVVTKPERALDQLVLHDPALVLVCEAIEKPGNLGAMLRTAEAAGVDAVIAASPVADWGNPNVVRASKATVFSVPVASAGTTDVIRWLRQQGVRIVVATPDAEDLVTDLDLSGPLAIVVGAEHDGVGSAWLDAADHAAKLPMLGHVNSLNVATSAAIVVYEALRQRG